MTVWAICRFLRLQDRNINMWHDHISKYGTKVTYDKCEEWVNNLNSSKQRQVDTYGELVAKVGAKDALRIWARVGGYNGVTK